MTKHTLVKLSIAAVAALGLALWVGNSRQPKQELPQDAALVPGLAGSVNDVKKLVITGAGKLVLVTLERRDAGWVVVERDGYAADVAKVRELLLKLADSTLVEAKTANPELHAKLGVEDVAGKDAKSLLLEVEGLAKPVAIVVGNYNGRAGESTFVRRDGDKQAWLAKGNLTLDPSAANWLRKDLFDVPSSRIREVRIEHGGKVVRATKGAPEDPNYQLQDVPKGREPASEFAANALASVLATLRFDDVVPAAKAEPPGDAWKATYTGFDGLVVETTAWQADGKDYARFAARVDEEVANAYVAAQQAKAKADHEAAKLAATMTPAPSPAPSASPAASPAEAPAAATPEPPAPLAVTDPVKDAAVKLDALRAEAKAINAKSEGWTFVLPSFKFANITKSPDDLLKPLDAKK